MAGIVVIYEVTKKSQAAAAPSPALPVGSTLPPAASGPRVLAVTRPDLPVGSAIFGAKVPLGPVVNLLPKVTATASPLAGQNITLALPLGSTWVGLVAGNTASPNVAIGTVNFGGDLKRAVSIPVNELVGANAFMAAWKNGAGAEESTFVTFPLVVAPKALTL